MKNQVLNSMIAFGFAALLGSTTAAAQVKQTATIPFSFEAGGVEYSEGNYAVALMPNLKMVKLTNVTNRRSVFVGMPILTGTGTKGSPKLVFSPNGDQMKLSEVWFEGYPGMLTSPPSKDVSAKIVVTLE